MSYLTEAAVPVGSGVVYKVDVTETPGEGERTIEYLMGVAMRRHARFLNTHSSNVLTRKVGEHEDGIFVMATRRGNVIED